MSSISRPSGTSFPVISLNNIIQGVTGRIGSPHFFKVFPYVSHMRFYQDPLFLYRIPLGSPTDPQRIPHGSHTETPSDLHSSEGPVVCRSSCPSGHLPPSDHRRIVDVKRSDGPAFVCRMLLEALKTEKSFQNPCKNPCENNKS